MYSFYLRRSLASSQTPRCSQRNRLERLHHSQDTQGYIKGVVRENSKRIYLKALCYTNFLSYLYNAKSISQEKQKHKTCFKVFYINCVKGYDNFEFLFFTELRKTIN